MPRESEQGVILGTVAWADDAASEHQQPIFTDGVAGPGDTTVILDLRAYRGLLVYRNITAKSGTNPTLDTAFSTADSRDGPFISVTPNVGTMAQLTSGSSLPQTQQVLIARNAGDTELAIGRYVKVVVTVGGTATPTWTGRYSYLKVK